MANDTYRLRRDRNASSRLNAQHMLWTDGCGWILHPKIQATLHEDSEIIDVGTGTGIVPLQLSKYLKVKPRSLVGYDISDKQFPPRQWVPDNTRFIVGDAFASDQPQPELKGRFDVAHCRFWLSLIKEDPHDFIKFVLRLLKPGGYIQWGEPLIHLSHVTTPRGITAPGMNELVSFLQADVTCTWLETLPQRLEGEGLEIVDIKKWYHEPWQRLMLLNNLYNVANEFDESRFNAQSHSRLIAEVEQGCWIEIECITIVARVSQQRVNT